MDCVGEINRCRTARQCDQIALGRETEDLILIHLELGILEKLLRVRGVLQNIEQFAQPAILATLVTRIRLFVCPVRRDAEFGDLVHFLGADLDLDTLTLRADDAGMQ